MKAQSEIIEPGKSWGLPVKKDQNGNYILIGARKEHSAITVTNRKRFPNGYIYFIKLQNQNIYKIGVSQNPQRRLSDIASYLPFEIEILSLHKFKNVYDIEDEILRETKVNRIKGEWFSISIETAKEIMINLHNLNVKQDGCATN